jgi:pimeloyl-ACP methyl ester carboxylesterase
MNRNTVRYMAKCAVDCYDAPVHGTLQLLDNAGNNRGYMLADGFGIMIAVSGTQSKRDFLIDCEVLQEHANGGGVHSGFWDEYEEIRDQVLGFISDNRNLPVMACGHSLGGAIATFVAEEAATICQRKVQLLTLGSPRPGNADFAQGFNMAVKDCLRIVHRWDFVPRIPKIDASHVGTLLHLDEAGRLIPEPTTFWQRAARDARIALADLIGQALRDHRSPRYLDVTERYLSGLGS